MNKYGTWKGIPREQVPWHPSVDPEKCAGCKACFDFCKHNVYQWDKKNNKTIVAEPYSCVVGCSSCSGLCQENAITFPPLSVLKGLA